MKWKLILTIIVLILVGAVSVVVFKVSEKKFEQQQPQIILGTANTKIRQEVNITDAYMYAGSGSYATSSAIVGITDSNYTGPTYYFEVVASTTSATNASVYLVNATSSATVATITVDQGNTYTRYRSSSFLPNSSSTVEYKVKLGNESVGKGLVSSRVIVLQNSGSGDLNNTETQIEIGCNESYTSTATTTCSAPKYWSYNSSNWDGSPTFYAEVTYANSGPVVAAASTTNTFTSDVTITASSTVTEVGAWGGGGAGFDGSNSGGGAGGGGGAFASSTVTLTLGQSYVIDVGAGGTSSGAAGADTTFNSTTVVADGGTGGVDVTTGIGTGGTTGNSTGTTKFAGGNGGQGRDGTGGGATDEGGGGGGAGGTAGAGGTGTNGSSGAGGDGGNGANGAGGAGATTDGGTGTSNVKGGGGGGGGANAGTGGPGGSPGAGGGGGEAGQGNGANGQVTLTAKFNVLATTTIAIQEDDGSFGSWTDKVYLITSSTFIHSTSTRVRSSSFTPTNGRHYRVAFREGYSGAAHSIYNAKIVVVQGLVSGTPQITQDLSDGAGDYILGGTAASGELDQAAGQSFTTVGAINTDRVDLYLDKVGSPTDNIYLEILSGSITGTVIGTSANVSASGVVAGYNSFTFSPAVSLSASTKYYMRLFRTGARDATNRNRWSGTVGAGSGSVYASNGAYHRDNNVWSSEATDEDQRFKVYSATTGSSPTLLEPQYLLAPFTLPTGTSLQKFLTLFDPAEWSTTNTYLVQADAADNSSSDVVLQDSTGGTTYATLDNPDNSATTTLTCISSTSTAMDTKATTNNNDVYSFRILVQVGGTATSACGVVVQNRPTLNVQGQTIIRGQVIVK